MREIEQSHQKQHFSKPQIQYWAYKEIMNDDENKQIAQKIALPYNGEWLFEILVSKKCIKDNWVIYALNEITNGVLNRKEKGKVHCYESEMEELVYLVERSKQIENVNVREWGMKTKERIRQGEK